MEEQLIVDKVVNEKTGFTTKQLETIENISKETFKEMIKDHDSKNKYTGLGFELYNPNKEKTKRESSTFGEGNHPSYNPSSLYPRILIQQKHDISVNDVFKSKLPVINKYLKDMVDFTNFMINEHAVKKDSKTMSTRKRNLEQMIKEYNTKLQRKYGFDVSTYKDINIDKVIKDIIDLDYPPIESSSLTTFKLKFDKQIDDKDDIGHLFDFRTFVNPHLILSLINYMAIKFNSLNNLSMKNVSIIVRPSYVYGYLLDRFFVSFEFTNETKESNKAKTTKKEKK